MNEPILKPKLKSRAGVPRGGEYALNLPEIGMVGRGYHFGLLVQRVAEYRKANAIPIGLGFEDEVEQAVCRQHPEACETKDVRIPVPGHRLKWQDVLRGTQMMVKFKLAGSPLVDEAEANRRAAICQGCPQNLYTAMPCGAAICRELAETVKAIIGARGTKYDDQLRSCGICHCYLQAACWVPLDIQQSVLSEEQKEMFRAMNELRGCWKASGL